MQLLQPVVSVHLANPRIKVNFSFFLSLSIDLGQKFEARGSTRINGKNKSTLQCGVSFRAQEEESIMAN